LSAPDPVLVDSSVWIDFLSPRPGPAGHELRRLIEQAEPVVLAGVVVTEILQGLSRDAEQVERYLSHWEMLEPEGIATYVRAAGLYRLARPRGLTLTTVDVLIAALALDYGARLFSLDKDFARLAGWTPLQLYAAV
jgi:predicted nucleic acid-binding protein